MSTSRFFRRALHPTRLSVKLFMGICLLGCLSVVVQTPSRAKETSVLIAQIRQLQEGDRGAAVTALQRQLNGNGLFPYSINGIYGPATTQAVRQFQRIRRLDVTGIADIQTLNLLEVDLAQLSTGLSHPIHGTISSDRITPASNREDVRILQRVLRSFGFNLSADGIYGAQTEQAVRAYERTAEIPVDGIADRATLLNMGFNSDGSAGLDRDSSSSRSPQGRYVAAVIEPPSELSRVRQDFPNATVERNNLGEYISIGRFIDQSDAADWADFASDLGYEARVLRD